MLSIYLVVPTNGEMDYRFVECINKLILDSSSNPKYNISIPVFASQSGIYRSRSIEATKFLKETTYDIMMMIDSDMTFSVEDVYQVCQEAHDNKAVVGAAYLYRRDPTKIVLGIKSKGTEEVLFGPGGHLKEVAGLGGGFMAIDRSVLENLAKGLPMLNKDTLSQNLIPFFHPIINRDLLIDIGEDVSFCERVTKSCMKVYCDTRITGVGHLSTRSYSMDDPETREKIQ